MKPAIPVLCLVAFAAFSGHLKHDLTLRGDSRGLDSLPFGHAVPDFTLKDRDGSPYTLSQVVPANTIVLVNFWGTWCAPCRLEMPTFDKMARDTSLKGLQILAIDEGDERAALDTYLKTRHFTFPILLDSGGALADKFGVRAYPTSIIIGSDGKVIRTVIGVASYWDSDIRRLIANAQKQPPTSKDTAHRTKQ